MARRETDVPPTMHTALDTLSLLSKKWHPVVVVTLEYHGPLGFNALLEMIPDVSGKVLAETLEALQDAGLVERTVVTTSPLRVEYGLTDAGSDMRSVFEALGDWGERHLETATPTVLLADADQRITEMYGQWLTDRYTVVRAHTGAEIESHLDATIDVLLVDERLPGVTEGELATVVGDTCRTIVLVGDRPGFDLLEIHCDDVLRKPIVRETALETIELQLARRGESPDRRELGSLTAKRTFLESIYPRDRLENSDVYVECCSRLETLEKRLEE